MTEPTLIVERRDGAAWLTLNRPDAGNAIDLALAQALTATADELAADPAVRCVVLTGAGRLFCAGGDISAFANARDASAYLHALASTLHRAIATFAAMSKPLLVLVNGPAAGAGLSLALLGDIVIASERAHFTAAYPAIGLTPDGGMSWLLPRCVGLRRAQAMILTNERVSAPAAAALGIVTRVVDPGQLSAESKAMVDRLVAAPTAAIGGAKNLLLQGATATLLEQLDREATAIASAARRAESREGIAAFLAKRPADFRSMS